MSDADVLRPGPPGLAGAVTAFAFEHIDLAFRVLRRVAPILRLGDTTVITRFDDVCEALATDRAFAAPYGGKLDVLMGGQPFMLGMDDTPHYRRDLAAMRDVVRSEDVQPRLTHAFAARAEAAVLAAGGRIEVVELFRTVTFDVLCDYFGVHSPPGHSLKLIGARLFEFQFADLGNDPALRKEVDVMAPLLRDHIDATIAARRQTGKQIDDVLGRCLIRGARGQPGFSDVQIRTALMGFLIGGPPQPPMGGPQGLEQLLRRPAALAGAQAAARSDDDELLAGYMIEAVRFDPVAAIVTRRVTADYELASGLPRAATIKSGGTAVLSLRSAMRDGRRISHPDRFDPRRLEHEYMHAGHGLHACFARGMMHACLPMILKPLLKAAHLRRAPGRAGRLSKRGVFADKLYVEYAV